MVRKPSKEILEFQRRLAISRKKIRAIKRRTRAIKLLTKIFFFEPVKDKTKNMKRIINKRR